MSDRIVSVNTGLFGDSVGFKIDNRDGSEPREFEVSEDELVKMLDWLSLQREAELEKQQERLEG